MGKSVEVPKLGIPNHFKSFLVEMIGEKYGKPKIGHSKSFWTTLVKKMGKVQND